MQDAAIHIAGVNKSFGTTHAVRDLHLQVPRGSLCGFLGPNGAGKSTTIRMIMSIIYPDHGEIDVLGSNAIKNKDRIGYLPEERGLYRKMRVGEFLEYMGKLKGQDSRGLKTVVQDWLERMALGDCYKKRCQELSKGMQQKIQFLASIIHHPDLLILDEPFSGLDPVNADLLNQMIREQHEQGTTIIFSTHVLQQAEEICDRIFLINHGVKLLDASLDDIRQQFDPRTVEVELAHGAFDAAGFDAIEDVQVGRAHTYELFIKPDTDHTELVRKIVQQYPVRSIQVRQVTLNDVFVQMVRNDEGSEAAQRAREELSHV